MTELNTPVIGEPLRRAAAAEAFAGLARELQSKGSAQEILQRIVDLAPQLIEPCGHAGITMVVQREVTTPAASSSTPRAVDRIQYEVDQGPCLDAMRKHAVFVTDDLASESRWPDFAARAAAETGIHSMLSFRLFVEQDTLGSLNLYSAERAAFGVDEMATGGIFAAHASIALASARQRDRAIELRHELALSELRLAGLLEQAAVATVLQRSMLTVLPQVDGLQLAARYHAAEAGRQVGGDWYDAFVQPDGATALAIGDVAGHDIGATVQMAQLRNMLRSLAFDRRSRPSDVLHRLDRVATELDIVDAATCIYATAKPPAGRGDAAGTWHVTIANAGHPPPLLVTVEGAEFLETDEHQLLGLATAPTRTDRAIHLPPGATLLLYTDGLVERRGHSISDGLAGLATLAHRVAGEPLDAFCDELLVEVAPGAEDDVSLLAVRPDRPRQ